MDDFELEIKREFLTESLMNLEEAENSFMELESSADPKPLLDKIFRLAHNLKGGSRAVGFAEVAEFTHQLENLVLKIQKSEVPLSSEVITILLISNDRLIEMLSKLKSDLTSTFDNSDILTKINNCLSGKFESTQENISTPSTSQESSNEAASLPQVSIIESDSNNTLSQFPDAGAFFPSEQESVAAAPPRIDVIEAVSEPTKVDTPPSLPKVVSKENTSTPAKESSLKDNEVIRVSLSRINTLNDYVGELIVLQSVIQQQSMLGNRDKVQVTVRQMAKLSKDIQGLAMSLRMLPVKPLVQKLQRAVRDTAQSLNKDVQLEIIGDQMEIDKSVLDRLGDPLIHILRNAVDHGLETGEERKNAGKATQGNVSLSFLNEGNHLIIEISDDGKGINTEVLRQKAIEKKVISSSESLTEKQIINLIFHAGFSTKSVTTEISGRGVGMDVVKTNIESIGGHIDVSTSMGKGSIFKLQIPLSLAVVEGLVIASDANRYVVPLSQVQETVNLKTHKVFLEKTGIGACFELRNTVVPIIFLDEALGAKNTKIKSDGTALIINIEDRPIALVVNDIVRAQQIVIKPLGNGIQPQKGWIGTCILGDGLPTLILSPIDLLKGRVKHSKDEQNIGGAA